jgi:hypothetical protein
MDNKKKLITFLAAMILAIVFWRILVFLNEGEISILRGVTGLNVHHYTYGIFMIFIAALIFLFYKVEKYSTALMGFGFGSFFDGFISRLLGGTSRAIEIGNYNKNLGLTAFLFLTLVLLTACVYLFLEKT